MIHPGGDLTPIRPFLLRQVRLLPGPFRDALELNRAYLRSLDPDRFLHMFRVTAGLPSTVEPLGGWEAPSSELRGHCMGHYLSGCALTFAATGDEELLRNAIRAVDGLAGCQKALGSGYLSAFPESFIDRVEACERVWAPYYTLHKILAGLCDLHEHAGSTKALEVAVHMAEWARHRADRLTHEQRQKMFDSTEQGGMNDAFCALYALTGDPVHLALSRRFNQRSYIEPLALRQDRLKGQHSNSYIPNVVGFARQYEFTGERLFRDVSSFFWDQVIGARSYATGGTSNYECWMSGPHHLADQLSANSHETCCTYNLLKLTRHLFGWTGDARYADYYERALLNGILSTIDPKTGMTMYYMAMEPGLYKTFASPLHSFWCCTGTAMESHAKYGDSIYFHDERRLYVNQFISSEVNWAERCVTVRQETLFPDHASTSLIFSAPAPVDLILCLRVPGWAEPGARVSVNGEPQRTMAAPGSYLTIERSWKNGDRVDVEMPMPIRVERLPDDPHTAAILCGPVVLAGQLGSEGLNEERIYRTYGPTGYPAPVPDLVLEDGDLASHLEPVADSPLTFRTRGIGRPSDVKLAPFHRTFERYAVYWYMGNEAHWRERKTKMNQLAERKTCQRGLIDEVRIGDAESEKTHHLQGEHTETGSYLQRPWRQATGGGWFSYRMTVRPGERASLQVTYWGADAGGRIFDILIDGEKIATEELDHKSPGQFVDVEYAIPEALTNRSAVTVRFQAHQPRRTAGGVFGLAVRAGVNEPRQE